MRKFKVIFEDEINFIKNQLIPLHKEGKFGFSQLIKQVFWVVYHGEELKGKSPPRTWKGIYNFIRDKNHIIHKAYYFRFHLTKNKRKREEFVKDFEFYLNKL